MKKSHHYIGFNSRRSLYSFLCILPFIIGFLLFTARPIIDTFLYSFSQTKFLPDATIRLLHVGFDNYQEVLMRDLRFRIALLRSLEQIGYMTPMIVILSLLIAMLLNSCKHLKHFYRAVFFLPVVLLQGPLLSIMKTAGSFSIEGIDDMFVFAFIQRYAPSFISSPILYIIEGFSQIVWHSGVPILICLAGLQKLDAALYEAAQVDGASRWQIFWKLTLPMARSFLLLSAVYTIIDLGTMSDNPLIDLIKQAMFTSANGFGFSAAVTWLYFFFLLLMIGLAYLLIHGVHHQKAGVV